MRTQQIRELLDSQGPALVLFAMQWCRCPDDAVQEAFIDLIQAPSWPDRPEAWLFAVTRNKAKNLGRSESRRAKRQQDFAEQNEAIMFTAPNHDTCIDPRQLRRALDKLPPEDRQLVVARTWGELKFEDLGCLIGCSTSAAHRRYQAALEQLRQHLEVRS